MGCSILLTAEEVGGRLLAVMVSSDRSVTGMLRKPPKKVVDLAGYKRSDKSTEDSQPF